MHTVATSKSTEELIQKTVLFVVVTAVIFCRLFNNLSVRIFLCWLCEQWTLFFFFCSLHSIVIFLLVFIVACGIVRAILSHTLSLSVSFAVRSCSCVNVIYFFLCKRDAFTFVIFIRFHLENAHAQLALFTSFTQHTANRFSFQTVLSEPNEYQTPTHPSNRKTRNMDTTQCTLYDDSVDCCSENALALAHTHSTHRAATIHIDFLYIYLWNAYRC